jgi:hypothetical protein
LVLLLHFPLLFLNLSHESLVEAFFGWVHFLGSLSCFFCHFLLFKEILCLLIDLFYLRLDSLVLVLPYVSLLFPHVSLLVHVGFDFLFTAFLFGFLLLEGVDDLLLQFLSFFSFELLFTAKFHFSLAFVLGDHIIFLFLDVVKFLEDSICHTVHEILGSFLPFLYLVEAILFLKVKHPGVCLLCTNIFQSFFFLIDFLDFQILLILFDHLEKILLFLPLLLHLDNSLCLHFLL